MPTTSTDFTINKATLSTPSGLSWSVGTAKWNTVPAIGGVTVSYSVVLYKGSTAVTNGTVTSTTNSYDFSSLIRANGTGTYTFKVTAISSNTANVNKIGRAHV